MQIGDKVRVTNRVHGESLVPGMIGTITDIEDDKDGFNIKVDFGDTVSVESGSLLGAGWGMCNYEIEKIE